DKVGAVLLPQLEELLAPELLVDLPGQAVALVHHARPASPAALLDFARRVIDSAPGPLPKGQNRARTAEIPGWTLVPSFRLFCGSARAGCRFASRVLARQQGHAGQLGMPPEQRERVKGQ